MKLSIKLVEVDTEYIANCPELDVNCYGSNREEAIRRLQNVLQFYIDSAHELGLEVEEFEGFSVQGELEPAGTNHNQPSSRSIN